MQTTLQNLVESAEAMQQDDQELEELEAAASPTRDGDEDDADDADDADDDTTRKSVGYYDLSQSERAGRVFVHLIMQAADDDDFSFEPSQLFSWEIHMRRVLFPSKPAQVRSSRLRSSVSLH